MKKKRRTQEAPQGDGTDAPFRVFTNIGTHENVTIRYENAGVGSRLTASVVDLLTRSAFWVLVLVIVAIVEKLRGISFWELIDALAGRIFLYIVVVYMVAVLLRVLYFTLFELLMHGKTPGKRALGLRVVSITGEAPSFSQILVRNAIRFFHLLPGGELVDGFVTLSNAHAQRAGDLAAGTMVIRERRSAGLDELVSEAKQGVLKAPEDGAPAPDLTQASPTNVVNVPEAIRKSIAPGAYLNWEDTDMLGRYLSVRAKLVSADELDDRMVALVARRTGDTPEFPNGLAKLQYLETVYLYNYNCFVRPGRGATDNG